MGWVRLVQLESLLADEEPDYRIELTDKGRQGPPPFDKVRGIDL